MIGWDACDITSSVVSEPWTALVVRCRGFLKQKHFLVVVVWSEPFSEAAVWLNRWIRKLPPSNFEQPHQSLHRVGWPAAVIATSSRTMHSLLRPASEQRVPSWLFVVLGANTLELLRMVIQKAWIALTSLLQHLLGENWCNYESVVTPVSSLWGHFKRILCFHLWK